jgi:putative ABC transport system permease protein
MLKNYFKIALRNLKRSKSFSFINIIGLAVGMASAVLILLWIQNETSYDQFHEKKDRVYEAWNRYKFSGELQCWSTTPKVMARAVEKDFPEVQEAVRVNWSNTPLFTIGDKKLTPTGNIVDSNFLHLFTFPMVKGNPELALKETYSIVLTEKLAEKLFGSEDPMGKVIKIDNRDNFTVTGVVKDPPSNTRFQFEFLMPWSYLVKNNGDDQSWGNNSTKTYVLLKENASIDNLNAKIKGIRQKYDKEDPNGEMFLYPMSHWRLYSRFKNGVEEGGLIDFVKMFGIIAGFILLIACINFMNLSTARSEKRAKEVGIRKVVGAQKGSLISQFLGESIILAFLAGVVALVIVYFCLPSFNELTDKKLFIDFSNPNFWLLFLGFIIFTGIIAGSYPAFFLSAFSPIKVLKGTFQKKHAAINPRKVLVVIQFTFAIILIIATMIVNQQIHHAQDRELGYNKDNLVYHMMTGEIDKNYDLIRNELLSSGTAVSVTRTSAPLTQGWSDTWGLGWKGKDPNDKTDFDLYCADQDLVKTAGLQLVAGRDLNISQFKTDSTGMVINESAVKAMKFKNPIGETVQFNDRNWHIVGVIKDFILQSPYYPTKPMVIMGTAGWFNVLIAKLNPNKSISDHLKAEEKIFKKYNPAYLFQYQLMDEEYDRKFKAERRTGTLAGLFSALTIFISCLGLFGLAAYMAENRIKEIGVRKVLGASVTNIATLLSKDFVTLVVISFIIASPVAFWAMKNWLDGYPYHVNIQWWIFLVAAMASVIIAMLTVSYHAVKAATANPVKSLRSE